jgi:hypothetical protein
MAYNSTYDLLGKKVSDTYPNLLQSGSDGIFYDGSGNSVTINATIPNIYATTGSNTFIGNQTITGSIYMDAPGTDSIYFSQSGPAGRLVWNDTDGTLDLGLKGGVVTLQIGQEQVVRVVNGTGGNLLEANYQAVRITGAQGQRLQVALAQANNDANSADTLGLVTETINNNQQGFVTISGLVNNINTTGTLQGENWTDGDVLYLSPTTPGKITNIKPVAPNHLVVVGYVAYRHQNHGKIFVKVDNGYEIDELHNVKINTASLAPGQLLVRSGSSNTGVWINTNQLTGSYGLTGSLQATSFTGSLQGTGSWAINALTASNLGGYDSTDYARKSTENIFTANQTIKAQSILQTTIGTNQTVEIFHASTESIVIPATAATQAINTTTSIPDITGYNLAIFDYVITPRNSTDVGLRTGQLRVGMYYDETGPNYYTTHTDTSLSDIGTYCMNLEFTNFIWEGSTLVADLQNNQPTPVDIYLRYKLTLI